jgi:hypothetical protein
MVNFVEQLAAIALLVVFVFGVACGFVGGASYGPKREDRKRTLFRGAPDAVSDGARVIHGLYTRDDDGYLDRLLQRGPNASGRPDESGSQGQELDP